MKGLDDKAQKRRDRLLCALAVAFGTVAGLGAYTFAFSEGKSYLRDDPRACINCHVMQEQHDSWSRSSHAREATCNDCHTPVDSFFRKYAVKADDGLRHSIAFTTGNFPDRILITKGSLRVVEESCRRCHAPMTESIDVYHPAGEETSCVRCHQDVGH